MTKTTRHLGFCPCCGKTFKVRGNKLVHHGYKRPGYGYIEGDCYGALRTPHELSDELAKEYRDRLQRTLIDQEDALAELPTLTKLTKTVTRRVKGVIERTVVDVPKTERPEGGYDFDNDREGALAQLKAVEDWERAYNARERYLTGFIRMLKADIERLTELVDTWKLTELTTVEEEQAQKQDAKAKREAAKAAKRQEKLNTAVTKYQKRIDSAVKNRNSNTLADIWESIQRKLTDIDPSLSKAEALTLVERDEVWEAFGLGGLTLSMWKAPEKPESEPLSRMKDRMDRVKDEPHLRLSGNDDWDRKRLAEMDLEWPESLGGENKKGAKTLRQLRAIQNGENPWKVK